MVIGTAGTAIALENCDLKALHSRNWDKAAGKAALKELTVRDLLKSIDNRHLSLVSTLHWLETLVDFVPALVSYKEWVSILFKTKAAKDPQPPTWKTKASPLGTNDCNEATMEGIKGAILDFSKQLGLDSKELADEVLIMSGDGMTYHNMQRLKRLAETSTLDEYRSFRWLLPILEVWHTVWTDLSRIARVHWGPASSPDYSGLWHNATRINHRTPPNFKKVDYYPVKRTVELVLSARILDCWR